MISDEADDVWLYSGPASRVDSQGAREYGRDNLTLFRSANEGESWHAQTNIWAGGAAYSSLAVVGNKTVAVAYERLTPYTSAGASAGNCSGNCAIVLALTHVA